MVQLTGAADALMTAAGKRNAANVRLKGGGAVAQVILLNKPFGVLSQFTDERSGAPRRTLAELIDVPGMYPAGRLDLDSEGLMVLCDDGRLQAKIADPRFKLPKSYLVQVEGVPDEDALEHLRTDHAHRHLGVSEGDLERWGEKAGLAVKSAKTFRSPDGDKGIAVTVWSAESQKSSKRSAA